MDTKTRHAGDFISYPTNRVVGRIADAQSAQAAIEALIRAGVDREDIDVLHGQEDLNRLDLSGAEHGFLAPFQRTLIRLAGPVEESAHLRRHVEDVRAGRFVIMVLAKAPDRRELVAGILNDHGAEFIGFYTTSQTASRNRRENERSLLARVRAVVMALREGGEIVEAAGTAHEDGRILEQIRDNWWRRRESNQKNGDFLTN